MKADRSWWRGAVIYQIYPRSFMDSNGDGVGDLRGITSKLPYVKELGADAIWISPFFTSPMRDFGYDVSDYRNVDAMFGDLDDFRELVDRAHALGLRVLIDQVLSHTSDQHPWFVESRRGADSDKSEWYVWADGAKDGEPPSNWLSFFGGSAWTWDEVRQQYYLHNFLESQPDLNFHNPDVRDAQLDNVRFWLDLGVDGFRFDVVNFFFHSADLKDNPPTAEGSNPGANDANPYFGFQHIHDIDQPENLDFLRELRQLLDEYPEQTSVGEISSDHSLAVMAQYTGGTNKLHMAYTFDLLSEDSRPDHIRNVIARLEAEISDGWPCWALSNHDVERSATRWGADSDPQLYPRIALALLLSLRGSVCLYQGEELGLPQSHVPRERMQDPYGLEFWPDYKGRDGCRTPMVWDRNENGGFSTSEPWLPVDEAHLGLSVEHQERTSDSTLSKVKRLIKWRKKHPALIFGDLELVQTGNDALCWVRRLEESAILVAINVTGNTLRFDLPTAIDTRLDGHGFAGRTENGEVILPPYEALFASLAVD